MFQPYKLKKAILVFINSNVENSSLPNTEVGYLCGRPILAPSSAVRNVINTT